MLVVAALIGTIKFDVERTARSSPRLHGMRYSSRPQVTAALILEGGVTVGRKGNQGSVFLGAGFSIAGTALGWYVIGQTRRGARGLRSGCRLLKRSWLS